MKFVCKFYPVALSPKPKGATNVFVKWWSKSGFLNVFIKSILLINLQILRCLSLLKIIHAKFLKNIFWFIQLIDQIFDRKSFRIEGFLWISFIQILLKLPDQLSLIKFTNFQKIVVVFNELGVIKR